MPKFDSLHCTGRPEFVNDKLTVLVLGMEDLKNWNRMLEKVLSTLAAQLDMETEGIVDVHMYFVGIPEDTSFSGADVYESLQKTPYQNIVMYHNVKPYALAPFIDLLRGDVYTVRKEPKGRGWDSGKLFKHDGYYVTSFLSRGYYSIRFAGFGHAQPDAAVVDEKDGNCTLVFLVRNGKGGRWRLREYESVLYLSEDCY